MRHGQLKRYNLSTDSTSKVIKPLMTISQCKTSLDKSYARDKTRSYKKKSSLPQLDTGGGKELNKVVNGVAKFGGLVTERREVTSRVGRPSPLSNLQVYKAQKPEHTNLDRQQIAFRKPKTIRGNKERISTLSRKSIDINEKMRSIQASSTKKLQPIHTKYLSLIHICRCRRYAVCRSRWSPYH
eukprot:TRINITY_DN3573_c0_g1_i1.p1 TRINITY_DN3573_c0_g1~~TRINITY_DN3573_c0_g1_i1.p1  ORF type:complete len:184 (+),score=40.06 TRINITY_DN3573_c0_g1_i1:427-978(+)